MMLTAISYDPVIIRYDQIMSDDECDHLIELARPRLARSLVVNRTTGGNDVSEIRTSEGAYFPRGHTEIIATIERRIANTILLPIDRAEPFQVMRYRVGGRYDAHHDFFDPADPGSAVHLAAGGQRIATMILYLNTPEAGGTTDFPDLGLSVRPERGSALYFEYSGQGRPDVRLRHGGMPVIQGEKWIATKWFRERVYP